MSTKKSNSIWIRATRDEINPRVILNEFDQSIHSGAGAAIGEETNGPHIPYNVVVTDDGDVFAVEYQIRFRRL